MVIYSEELLIPTSDYGMADNTSLSNQGIYIIISWEGSGEMPGSQGSRSVSQSLALLDTNLLQCEQLNLQQGSQKGKLQGAKL